MENNYRKMADAGAARFLTYDTTKMAEKFHLAEDERFLYLRYFGQRFRVSKTDAAVSCLVATPSADCQNTGDLSGREESDALPDRNGKLSIESAVWEEADFESAMTIYDLLCYSKDDCRAAGTFVHMRSLGDALVGAKNAEHFYQTYADLFDKNPEKLSAVLTQLDGVPEGKGDVAYRLPMFDFMDICLTLWCSDDEFPASLGIFLDENILDFMHYETVWYTVGHLLARVKALFEGNGVRAETRGHFQE